VTSAGRHLVAVLTSPERGGAEYATVDMLALLVDRGWRVELLTDQPELVEGTDVPARRIELGPKLSRRSVAAVAGAAPSTLLRLTRALRREAAQAPIDVLLVCFKKEQLLSALLPPGIARAIVWAEWGPLPTQLGRGLPRPLYVAAARRARRVLAESEGTRRSLLEAGVPADKIAVVPNVLDGDKLRFDLAARQRLREQWGACADTYVIGCVTRLGKGKRTDVVIDALAHLDGDVLLVIAGDGDGEDELRQRAAPFGGRVLFVPTPRGWVHELLSACDVQVFAPSAREGDSRAAAFGHLAERPVIATASQGALATVAPGTGAIVSPEHDARALAACLQAYAGDAARRAREGSAGRRRALDHHGAAHVGATLEDALLDVLR